MGKYAEYENAAGIAGLPLCNFGGLLILDIIYGIDDYIVSCFNYGDGNKAITKGKIYYTNAGRAYFRKYGRRYYLDEIQRF